MDTRSIKHLSASSHESLALAAAAFLADNRGSPGVVIVTRNKLAADELVYRNSHLGPCGVYRLTTEQLVQELSRKRVAGEGRQTASALTLDAITRRSVNAAIPRLNYFVEVAKTPRFSGALLRSMREIRLNGIESSVLQAGGPAPKDIAILLDRYERELGDHGLTDLRDRIDVALEVVRNGCYDFCGLPLVLLCPEADHKARRLLLPALVETSPAVLGLSLHHEHGTLERILQIHPTPLERTPQTCLERGVALLRRAGRSRGSRGARSLDRRKARLEVARALLIGRLKAG